MSGGKPIHCKQPSEMQAYDDDPAQQLLLLQQEVTNLKQKNINRRQEVVRVQEVDDEAFKVLSEDITRLQHERDTANMAASAAQQAATLAQQAAMQAQQQAAAAVTEAQQQAAAAVQQAQERVAAADQRATETQQQAAAAAQQAKQQAAEFVAQQQTQMRQQAAAAVQQAHNQARAAVLHAQQQADAAVRHAQEQSATAMAQHAQEQATAMVKHAEERAAAAVARQQAVESLQTAAAQQLKSHEAALAAAHYEISLLEVQLGESQQSHQAAVEEVREQELAVCELQQQLGQAQQAVEESEQAAQQAQQAALHAEQLLEDRTAVLVGQLVELRRSHDEAVRRLRVQHDHVVRLERQLQQQQQQQLADRRAEERAAAIVHACDALSAAQSQQQQQQDLHHTPHQALPTGGAGKGAMADIPMSGSSAGAGTGRAGRGAGRAGQGKTETTGAVACTGANDQHASGNATGAGTGLVGRNADGSGTSAGRNKCAGTGVAAPDRTGGGVDPGNGTHPGGQDQQDGVHCGAGAGEQPGDSRVVEAPAQVQAAAGASAQPLPCVSNSAATLAVDGGAAVKSNADLPNAAQALPHAHHEATGRGIIAAPQRQHVDADSGVGTIAALKRQQASTTIAQMVHSRGPGPEAQMASPSELTLATPLQKSDLPLAEPAVAELQQKPADLADHVPHMGPPCDAAERPTSLLRMALQPDPLVDMPCQQLGAAGTASLLGKRQNSSLGSPDRAGEAEADKKGPCID